MKIGPKFKIARRLGAPIFEKTQTQKFKASSENRKPKGRKGSSTNFGIQLVEKQKARYTYGMSEKQFSKYVKAIIEKKAVNPTEKLFTTLESRLDNVIARIGLGTTRSFARQLVSHGHIRVNGKRMDIPSYLVQKNDVITIREGSAKKTVFQDLEEKLKGREIPMWITREQKDSKNVLAWKITGLPAYTPSDLLFDLNAVIQFYKR